jgi:Na+-translocating ferredoxin:NAD+ oxidoreductase RnfG subunit
MAIRLALLVSVLGVSASAAAAQSLTQEQALRLAFPLPLSIERRTAYLDAAQLARVRQLAGGNVEVAQRVVTYYVGLKEGNVTGTAYFDSHRVRTLGEVLMLVVDGESKIDRIEVLRFAEPPEYRTPDGWLEQFEGKELAPDLSLKRDIVPITGATLSATAVTNAARRVLALHTVINSSSKAQ